MGGMVSGYQIEAQRAPAPRAVWTVRVRTIQERMLADEKARFWSFRAAILQPASPAIQRQREALRLNAQANMAGHCPYCGAPAYQHGMGMRPGAPGRSPAPSAASATSWGFTLEPPPATPEGS